MALALVACLPALAQDPVLPPVQPAEEPVAQPPQEIQDELSQERRYTMYGVMFYNLENLFDTINNNGVYDKEFSPEGARQWNGTKYWQKQHNMAYTISQMEAKGSPAVGVRLKTSLCCRISCVSPSSRTAITRLFTMMVLIVVVWTSASCITRAFSRS